MPGFLLSEEETPRGKYLFTHRHLPEEMLEEQGLAQKFKAASHPPTWPNKINFSLHYGKSRGFLGQKMPS